MSDKPLVPQLSERQKQSLLLSNLELKEILNDGAGDEIFVEDGRFTKKSRESIYLDCDDTFEFLLGKKPRPYYMLQKTDVRIIYNKFKDMLEYIQKNSAKDKRCKGSFKQTFFDAFQIRVSNKEDGIGQECFDYETKKHIPYEGEIHKGSALFVVLPDCPKDESHKRHLVQLVGMNISPNLQDLMVEHQIELPKDSRLKSVKEEKHKKSEVNV